MFIATAHFSKIKFFIHIRSAELLDCFKIKFFEKINLLIKIQTEGGGGNLFASGEVQKPAYNLFII